MIMHSILILIGTDLIIKCPCTRLLARSQLFYRFCSAILYGKLTSFQSNAKVSFSQIICVSYGEEVDDDDDDSVDSDDYNGMSDMHKRKIACPTIRFRIANQLHSNQRGEIIDCSLNVFATIDAKNSILGIKSDRVFSGALKTDHSEQSFASLASIREKAAVGVTGVTTVLKKTTGGAGKGLISATRGVSSVIKKSAAVTKMQAERLQGMSHFRNSGKSQRVLQTGMQAERLQGMSQFRKSGKSQRVLQALEPLSESMASEDSSPFSSRLASEDSGSDDILHEMSSNVMVQDDVMIGNGTNIDQPNLVFASLNVEPASHPFFRSTWVVNHRLDASSPLLTKSARKKVMRNGGFWPDELDNEAGLNACIHFDNLLVSFQGQSKIAGTQVYHQQTYTMDDLKVGFQFESVLMQNSDNSIFVRVNDVDLVKKQHRQAQSPVPAPTINVDVSGSFRNKSITFDLSSPVDGDATKDQSGFMPASTPTIDVDVSGTFEKDKTIILDDCSTADPASTPTIDVEVSGTFEKDKTITFDDSSTADGAADGFTSTV